MAGISSTRQQLLAALRARPGEWCSGQALADRLGVSRAAVHKAAAALAAQGWRLDAQPRRGYRLAGSADLLCAEALGPYPAPVFFYETLESTNRTAKLLAADAAAPHGTLVVAGQQTEGRGRLGRRFESPPGGVYLTLLLRPALAAPQALAVTGSAAVAVCRAVEALCGLSLSIKWVNDLFYGGKKVGGILTELAAEVDTGAVEWIAVGIGVNLAVPESAFPPELSRIAGSLYPGGSAPVGRAALAGEIARQLLALCPDFDSLDEYRARCFVPGHWVTVSGSGEPYSAKAVAIDEAGRLVVETAGGRRTALSHGEVSVKPALP
jgi:BirA family biotin operon repressor/biotin-[acetyl-CoA-carboxylase] ligase